MPLSFTQPAIDLDDELSAAFEQAREQSAAINASARDRAQRRGLLPLWRFDTHINENNIWHVNVWDFRESVRDYPGNLCPQERVSFSRNNRYLSITLTSVADLDNFVQPFLNAQSLQISPSQKGLMDIAVKRLRLEFATPISTPLLLKGLNMIVGMIGSLNSVLSITRMPVLHIRGADFQASPPLTYQQRLENIRAHPQFSAMAGRMFVNKAQFDEWIIQWRDPVTLNQMEAPVLLPEEVPGKPRIAVERTTFNAIMDLPNLNERINPITRAPIPADYIAPEALDVHKNIQEFLNACENVLQSLDMEMHHPLRYFW